MSRAYLGREVLQRSCLNGVDGKLVVGMHGRKASRYYESCRYEDREMKDDGRLTKPFLRGASTLDYLYEARPERFNRRNVISENTHVTGGCRQVDLHNVCRGEDRLPRIGVTDSSAGSVKV